MPVSVFQALGARPGVERVAAVRQALRDWPPSAADRDRGGFSLLAHAALKYSPGPPALVLPVRAAAQPPVRLLHLAAPITALPKRAG